MFLHFDKYGERELSYSDPDFYSADPLEYYVNKFHELGWNLVCEKHKFNKWYEWLKNSGEERKKIENDPEYYEKWLEDV